MSGPKSHEAGASRYLTTYDALARPAACQATTKGGFFDEPRHIGVVWYLGLLETTEKYSQKSRDCGDFPHPKYLSYYRLALTYTRRTIHEMCPFLRMIGPP